jgi:hypothetical protein
MESKELQVMNYSEVKALADTVVKSRLFTAFGNPDQALVLMMMAQVEGCHPMQAVQRYDVIQGKPAKKSDAMLADFQMRGGTVTWTEYTDDAVEAEFMAKGMAKPCKVRWTYKQATEAGLTGKPTWKQYKRQMLKARVISEGVRISDPGVVAGLYTPEEVSDFSSVPPAAATATPAAEVVEATAVEPTPETKPAMSHDRTKRIRALAIAIKAAGVTEENRKTWMSEKIGRQVESSKDLTDSELSTLEDAAKSAEAANGST